MRGTLILFRSPFVVGGIIPAHAGNTGGQREFRHGIRDHPRACGEHGHQHGTHAADQGSSPRMRGTLQGRETKRYCEGIIPAHAGNTHGTRSCHPTARDHPRACGEHSINGKASLTAQGSSPRMRGTHSLRKYTLRHAGIIPAHAGNTDTIDSIIARYKDHPRACGEHAICT